MKKYLIVLVLFISCKEIKESSNANLNNSSDIVDNYDSKKRITFKNISEIVNDSCTSNWVNQEGDNFSLALHFQSKDTLDISYSPECWMFFNYKLEGEKIVVYWDVNIDTKYDFEIVKAINKINKKYIGKPFMSLELVNDTTFKTNYLIKEIVDKINNSEKSRIFFPEKFILVQEGEQYD